MKHIGSKSIIKYSVYLVVAVLFISVIALPCIIETKAITYVGVCGEDIKWYLDGRTGTLKIEGSGAITDFENYDDSPWYEYRDIIETVKIDNGIVRIPANMFYRAEHLEIVEISKSVIEIGRNAFYGCSSLRTVDFQKNSLLSIIGEGAFAYCRNLSNFTMPGRVIDIQKNAFLYCYKLPDITLGYSVKTIGEDAFSGCSFLEKIRVINYECDIFDDGETIYNNTVIESFGSSTAKAFAEKYLRDFSVIKDMKFLNDMEINLSSTEYSYDGKAKKPKVTVKGLKEGKDFSVDYIKNKEPGIAVVTVSAAGDSLGEVTLKYKINPAKVENLRIDERKEDSLKLIWDAVHGANEYVVYQLINNEWEKLGKTEKMTYQIKDLTSSGVYQFKVRAVTEKENEKCSGEFSDWLTTSTKPESPEITSVSNRGIGRLALKWTSVENSDGYEIYISEKKNKNYKLAGETVGRYRCSYIIRNLESNQKYYVKIKAYKTVDGFRIYSSESNIISKSAM